MRMWLFLLIAGLNLRVAAVDAVKSNISTVVSLYKPFVIQEEDGRLTGVYQEYLSELVKKAGLQANFEIMPTSRVLNHATKGTFDTFVFVSGTPEAQKNYIEVTKFHKIQMIMVTMNKNLSFTKKDLVVGKPAGHFCPMLRQEHEKMIRLFDYQNTEQAIRMMLAKRMDAICTSREIFYYELRRSPYARTKIFEMPEYEYEYVISLFVNRKMPTPWVHSITKAALDLEQKKTIPLLYKKYGILDPKNL